MNHQNAPVAVPPKEATLNDRLFNASDRIENLLNRIEMMLSRVNGTPTPLQGAVVGGRAAADTRQGPLALASCVEHLESSQSRLQELVSGLERIA